MYVPSGNDVRLVDLAARTVKVVFHAAEPIESLGTPFGAFYARGVRTGDLAIVVRTLQQIQRLNRNHEVTMSFIIPTGADRQNRVSWYELGNGRALAVFQRPDQTRGAVQVAPHDDLPNCQ